MAGSEDVSPHQRPTQAFLQRQRGSTIQSREGSFSPQPEDSRRALFRSSNYRHGKNVPFSQDLQFASLFRKCSSEFIDALQDHFPTVFIESGRSIIDEGSIGECMYVLRHGEVDVEVRGNMLGAVDDLAARDVTIIKAIKTLREGDVFGEVTVLPKPSLAALKPVAYTAKTVCICRKVPRATLNQILKLFPADKAYLEAMAERAIVDLLQTGKIPDVKAGMDWRRAVQTPSPELVPKVPRQPRRGSMSRPRPRHAFHGRRASTPGALLDSLQSARAESPDFDPSPTWISRSATVSPGLSDSEMRPTPPAGKSNSFHNEFPAATHDNGLLLRAQRTLESPQPLPIHPPQGCPNVKLPPLRQLEEAARQLQNQGSTIQAPPLQPLVPLIQSAQSAPRSRSCSPEPSNVYGGGPRNGWESQASCKEWCASHQTSSSSKVANMTKSRAARPTHGGMRYTAMEVDADEEMIRIAEPPRPTNSSIRCAAMDQNIRR